MSVFLASKKSFWLVILPICFLLLFFRLGDRSFRNPDEGRYAKIAQEMVRSGDWTAPTLYGIDYLRKPPMLYWLVGASFRWTGYSEFSARAVPAIFSVLGIGMIYFFVAKVFDPRTAFFSSMILLTNLLYVNVGRLLIIDAVFSFFVVTAFFMFYLSHFAHRRRLFYAVLFYLSVSAAFLAKGILGLALPAAAIFFFGLVTRKLGRFILDGRIFLGILVFLLVAGPWIYLISLRKPEFWDVFLIREHFQRLTASNFEHQEGWHYYWVMTAFFSLPWILFIKPLKYLRTETVLNGRTNPLCYALVCAFSTVAFLSFSKSKLVTYILPALPPLAMVLGRAWACWDEPKKSEKILSILTAVLSVICLLSLWVAEKINADYTTKPFAMVLKERLRMGDPVFIYDHPGAFYDFGFYLNHPVRLVGLEGEFEISRENESAQRASISRDEFMRVVKSGTPLYTIIRRSDFEGLDEFVRKKVRIIHENQRKVLFESGGKNL